MINKFSSESEKARPSLETGYDNWYRNYYTYAGDYFLTVFHTKTQKAVTSPESVCEAIALSHGNARNDRRRVVASTSRSIQGRWGIECESS